MVKISRTSRGPLQRQLRAAASVVSVRLLLLQAVSLILIHFPGSVLARDQIVAMKSIFAASVCGLLQQ
jgi:hypothetical protein